VEDPLRGFDQPQAADIEWKSACHDAVEHHAKGVDIAARVVGSCTSAVGCSV
jgi:hypothetical protein